MFGFLGFLGFFGFFGLRGFVGIGLRGGLEIELDTCLGRKKDLRTEPNFPLAPRVTRRRLFTRREPLTRRVWVIYRLRIRRVRELRRARCLRRTLLRLRKRGLVTAGLIFPTRPRRRLRTRPRSDFLNLILRAITYSSFVF